MADQHHHSVITRRVASQLHLSQYALAQYGAVNRPSAQKQFTYGNYSNAVFSSPMTQSLMAANASPVFVQAPAEKGLTGFAIDFLMGGVSAAVSKTAAAPIERVKL